MVNNLALLIPQKFVDRLPGVRFNVCCIHPLAQALCCAP